MSILERRFSIIYRLYARDRLKGFFSVSIPKKQVGRFRVLTIPSLPQ